MKNKTVYIEDKFIPHNNNIKIERDVVYLLIDKQYLSLVSTIHNLNPILLQHGWTEKSESKDIEYHWWEIDVDFVKINKDIYARPGYFEIMISGKRKLLDAKIFKRDYFIDKILENE